MKYDIWNKIQNIWYITYNISYTIQDICSYRIAQVLPPHCSYMSHVSSSTPATTLLRAYTYHIRWTFLASIWNSVQSKVPDWSGSSSFISSSTVAVLFGIWKAQPIHVWFIYTYTYISLWVRLFDYSCTVAVVLDHLNVTNGTTNLSKWLMIDMHIYVYM